MPLENPEQEVAPSNVRHITAESSPIVVSPVKAGEIAPSFNITVADDVTTVPLSIAEGVAAVRQSMISGTSINADGSQGNSAFAMDVNGDGVQDIYLSLPPGVSVRIVPTR